MARDLDPEIHDLTLLIRSNVMAHDLSREMHRHDDQLLMRSKVIGRDLGREIHRHDMALIMGSKCMAWTIAWVVRYMI